MSSHTSFARVSRQTAYRRESSLRSVTRRFIPVSVATQLRCLSTVNKNAVSALTVFNESCYHKIDFKIRDDRTANEAVKRFAAFNIGCLAVTDESDQVVGVVSERDYINQVSAVGKDDKKVTIRDICTYTPNVIIAKKDDTVEQCMNKMLFKDIRHLLVMDDSTNECVGMISI